MSEEQPMQSFDAGFSETDQLSASGLVIVDETLERFMKTASAQTVYGQPIQNGDTIVIPTAEVACVLGFGAGAGGGGPKESGGKGAGGGGGGYTFSRPAAAIVITPQSVEIRPILDMTKIFLALLTAVGFMISTLARMRRRRLKV